MRPSVQKGLENVYVDETSISDVDGEAGRLIYRDRSIEELAQADFLDVAFLVVFGREPSPDERRDFAQLLNEHSDLTAHEIAILRNVPAGTHPMKVLQGMIPLLELCAKPADVERFGREACEGLRLAAKVPALIAAYFRLQSGQEVLRTQQGLSFHENFLYRFNGRLPAPEHARILDVTQILQMEHSLNASTFAARVTASTLAPIECAVSSAVGTLFGKLHGGADQAATEMAIEIGVPQNADEFVLSALARKEKIMGMGHRIYRVIDPRAKVLKPLARSLCLGTPFENLYLTLEAVEDIMAREMEKHGKQIKANVEFYKGAVFYALGIPPKYFTAIFAMSRVFGYVAHVLESRNGNRLIRPKAVYVPSV